MFTNGDDDETLVGLTGDVDALDGDDRITIIHPEPVSSFVVSGGKGEDTIFGGQFINRLRGGDDNDELYGGERSDNLAGDGGDDLIDGGDGIDLLYGGDNSLRASPRIGGSSTEFDYVDGTDIRKPSGDDTLFGRGGDDSLYGFDGDDELYGGDRRDTIYGGANNDLVYGGADEDTIYAGGGNDTVFGDGSDDFILATEGNNALYGGEGRDSIFGGEGNDTIYADNRDFAGAAFLQGGNGVDLLTLALASAGEQIGMGLLTDFERLEATPFDDTIFGGQADEISGGGGDDLILSTSRGQNLDGGAGVDQIRYRQSDAGVRVYLDPAAENAGSTARGGHAQGDKLTGFEGVAGSDFGDDLRGDFTGNLLEGWAGDDWLRGRDGDDSLRGNGDDDTLEGGAGADMLDGGIGRDTASYRDSAFGVAVDLAAKTASDGDAAGDALTSIENLTGSYKDDTLTGDDRANDLRGSFGDDILEGGQGADTLSGGVGSDTLTGGKGADVFLYNAEWHNGEDTITDFEEGLDLIQIRGDAAVELIQEDWGTIVLIQGEGEAMLTLKNAWEVDFDFIG